MVGAPGAHRRASPPAPPSRRAARVERQLRECYRATAMSTLVPAAGLFRARPLLASVILALFVVPLVYAGVVVFRGGALGSVLRIGVDRQRLLVIVGAVAVLAAAWIVGIVATAWSTRPREASRGQRVRLTAFVTAMALVVAAPAAFAVQGIDIQRDTLEEIVTESTRPPTTKPDRADPWEDIPRVNVLLLGSDAEPDREGTRPDSIMVASIDTATGDTVFIGLPRNLQRVPFPTRNPLSEIFPAGYDCGSECLLNGVWTLAESRPDLFPGDPSPGLTTTRDVVSEVTGLTIDDTVLVDLRGFAQLVDAMGGVTINVTERVSIGGRVVDGRVVGISGWIEPGVQHMDGYHALWYARSRATTDDYSRMRRQRCVVGAIVDQVDPIRMLARYPRLAGAIADNVKVDIPADDLPAWAELVLRMKDGRLRSLPITDQVVNTANPDFDLIRELVDEAVTTPPPPLPPTTSAPTTTVGPDGQPVGPTGTATDPNVTDPNATDPGTPEPTDTLADLAATC